MYDFIKRMFMTKKDDTNYYFSDTNVQSFVAKGWITQAQADEICALR